MWEITLTCNRVCRPTGWGRQKRTTGEGVARCRRRRAKGKPRSVRRRPAIGRSWRTAGEHYTPILWAPARTPYARVRLHTDSSLVRDTSAPACFVRSTYTHGWISVSRRRLFVCFFSTHFTSCSTFYYLHTRSFCAIITNTITVTFPVVFTLFPPPPDTIISTTFAS